jgi:spore coat protein H
MLPLLLACADPAPTTTPVAPVDSDPPAPMVLVGELLAHDDGPDWIELVNPGPDDVDLQGWTIADDARTTPHRLGAISVPAGGAVQLLADGTPELGPEHLGFKLDDDEAVLLTAPDGRRDGLRYGRLVEGVSLARTAGGWTLQTTPTPGVPDGLDAAPGDDALPGPLCAPTLDAPWLREGRAAVVEARCEVGVPTLLRGPPDAGLDGARLRWRPGPEAAGRYEVVVSAAVAPGLVPSAERAALWVADDPGAPGATPPDPLQYTEEWGLPTIFIDTEAPISQEDTPARLTFGGARYDAQIKIRGASSAGYPKPGYTIELIGDELPIPAWGVSRDHLVLATTFDDNSYVRQKLIYDLWAAMAAHAGARRLTPRTFFTVLYLDGAYHGLYLALDRIDDEYLDQMGLSRDCNLYKAVNHEANFSLYNSWGSRKGWLHDGYTKEEGLPAEDFADLDALITFTGGSDAGALMAGAGAWFDTEEFADWFLLVYYALAEDSAGKNSYLAHDPLGGPFRYSPWDFNHSWGQGWYTYRTSAEQLNDFTSNNRVFWAMQRDPAASAALWARLDDLRATGPLDPAWLRSRVEAYWAEIDPSAERDQALWGDAYRSYGGWAWERDQANDWTDYRAEKAYLRRWLDDRAAVIQAAHP